MLENGGAEGIRTPDPHNAIVVLYQLSYDPIQSGQFRILRRNVKAIFQNAGSNSRFTYVGKPSWTKLPE